MRRLFLVLVVTASTVPAAEPTHPCFALDEDARDALSRWLRDRYPPPGHSTFCGAGIAPHNLRARPLVVAECIEKIFHDGLAGSELWSDPSPAPNPAPDVLTVLPLVDKARAARLWKEWGDRPACRQGERFETLAVRSDLGDVEAMDELIGILERLPDLDLDLEDRSRIDWWIPFVVHFLARADYRPAASVLASLRDRFDEPTLIDLAQLERDIVGLERSARESPYPQVAVRSLARIGACDVLERLAQDPENPHRAQAQAALIWPP